MTTFQDKGSIQPQIAVAFDCKKKKCCKKFKKNGINCKKCPKI